MASRGVVPNGGWGWYVVFGTALINVFNQSILSMFGLVFGPKLETIAGTTGLTTVMSINCTITNFSGFLISPLLKYLNYKQITQIGVLFVSGGLILSSFTTSYMQLIVGYGLFAGLGLGLISSSTFLIINSYFSSNKSQAVGLAMAGTSFGQMALPPVVAFLVEYYGYNGTILILSALSLHGLIGSIFFLPVSEQMVKEDSISNNKTNLFSILKKSICCCRHNRVHVLEDKLTPTTETFINNNDLKELLITSQKDLAIMDKPQINSVSAKEAVISLDNVAKSTDEVNESIYNLKAQEITQRNEGHEATFCNKEETKENRWKKIVKLFDLDILLDPYFVHIMIGLSFAYTTSVSFSTFFPLFLTKDLNMTVIEASMCMTILSLNDLIGRILVPLITKQVNMSHRSVFIIGMLILAASRFGLVLQTTQGMTLLLSAVCGLARAATVINQNLVIAEYSKEAHVSSAVGLNMVSKGVFVLTIGRLLGWYKDSSHNYASIIQILNVISIGVVVSWTIELLIKNLFKKTK